MTQAPQISLPQDAARRLWWLLLLATILLAVGVNFPMLTISQFFVMETSFSVISGIYQLLLNGQILLFILVALFSLILPVLKIVVLFRILSVKHGDPVAISRYLRLMHEYGRWSMLDVLVVAVLIVAVKLGTIASIEIHFGLYVFAAAVLLIMYITNRVVSLSDADSAQ
jgi:paraquat-inducible protein A